MVAWASTGAARAAAAREQPERIRAFLVKVMDGPMGTLACLAIFNRLVIMGTLRND
jgi:hypothetical protein